MRTLLSIVVALVVMAAFVACQGKTSDKSGDNADKKVETKKTALKQTYTAPQAKVGDLVICPVMPENSFTVEKDSLAVTIKGKTYYVCCGGCPDPLKKDPDKYLK